MDSITLDGKVYIKGAKAAALVGYTADYVGQLSRKGELDATMLGKTWYVREESLLAHKASKVRINTATTKRDIAKHKDTLDKKPRPEVYTGVRAGERHKHIIDTPIRYSPDTDELLPSIGTEVPKYGQILATPELATPDDEKPKVTSEYASRYGTQDDAEDAVALNQSDEQRKGYGAEQVGKFHDLNENNEGIPIPIHKMDLLEESHGDILGTSKPFLSDGKDTDPEIENKLPPGEVSLAMTANQMRDIRTQRVKKDSYFRQHTEEIETTQLSSGGTTTHGSFLWVIMTLLAFIFLTAIIILESTWSYDGRESVETPLSITYNPAPVSSIIKVIQEARL